MKNKKNKAHKALRLHGSIAHDIGVAIVSGRYRPGHVLAGEVEASSRRRVSRTAYREAVRILSAKGLVHSRPRVGTRVSALADWHLLDPDVLSWVFHGEPAPEAARSAGTGTWSELTAAPWAQGLEEIDVD